MAGARESYRREHVLRTLLLIWDRRTGRKKLVKELGVGEGSVRTILKKLKREGLISSVKQGHALTEKGRGFVERLLLKFTRPQLFESYDLACGSAKSVAVVHDASAKIKRGIDERDTAVKAGADGAVILVCKEGKIGFPAEDAGLDELPETRGKVEKLRLRDGDVVVIAFGKDAISAEDGVLAVVTELLGLKLP
jgi:Mn-dependent DtxR family transcriptional regulator